MLINFVYDYPKEDLFIYSLCVVGVMSDRGYKINLTNFVRYFGDLVIKPPVYSNPFAGKMTDKYLAQCYFNLMEKHDCGGMTDEEWENIEKVARERVKKWVLENL